jgi:putative phosphoesterase
MLSAIVRLELPFDELVFCGDGFADIAGADLPASFIISAVAGNVDRERGFSAPEQLVTEIGEKKVLITHGDLFGVKIGLERLRHHGVTRGADLVIFGHTHEQYADTSSRPILINPGSAQRGHYCIIEMDGSVIRPVFKALA